MVVKGDFQLRQIGAMIFTMTKLEQPIGRHRSRRGGRIQTDGCGLQLIGANDRAVQIGLKRLPVLIDVEVVQSGRQAIIAAIARLDCAAQPTRECHLVLGHPERDLLEPVIGWRDDEGQPDDAPLSQTQSRPIAVGREMLVNQFGHAQLGE